LIWFYGRRVIFMLRAKHIGLRLIPNVSHSNFSQGAHPVSPPSPLPLSAHSPQTPTRSLRIYSWNINGIQPFLPPTTPQITKFLASSSNPKPAPTQPSLRANLLRWKWPHIIFLQEVKIAPSDTKTIARLHRAIIAPLEGEPRELPNDRLYNTDSTLPRDKYNATGFGGKVYGVSTLVRRDLSSDTTVKSVGWDLEGRVQVVEISSLGLVVINVYAVNGTTNDYLDPTSGKVVGNRHDRKRSFHSLLANEVSAYEEKGWGVIVAGDINISRSKIDSFPQLRMGEDHVKNRADFEEKFINGLGMIDSFRLLHGDEKKYSYRPRNKPWGAGGDRVDLILVTKGLRECVREADVLDGEVERGPSDHVPLFVELEVKRWIEGKQI